ncbi:MetS family NSS transporter small subunit [Paenactinomyces guangxiensis]|uniref:MetS family NSS transporter small subunit n=1 Tax=Paenactinomyces guangxiensis TaxID=1490290 RepID=A0A7W2A8F5_9BACL|nr:MetS family NSS transporter small subunit [Paenactinomyces guangxiensis]MBA4493773.1 MetS family NSS transporter small subunit [Paenactinomyces guangxiensis]MBH8591062.1 MetS family NSS transporter small subunit [Paenactinomyces guangxiensis]
MSVGAWIMLFLGAVLLWGGLAYFLFRAYRSNQQK